MSSAQAMPQASPLRPTSHWRSGNAATFVTRMLKSQPFRQLERLAAAGEGEWSLTGGQRAYARHSRRLR